ncbi:DUF6896 domain-containing protein [Sphingobacterium bambusae]|uniref:DUF6896 domain-containing protein n=1 Tax=Sphingobacterium bambusae TaxID=662858 RepID=A0ABW6BNV1_9SPHI|nr:hypothetical protein [Sphingobacterium bambusae]WPL47893.1 hypothetical protein SCB77_18245 [Sphingobacterium bambusae]
MKDIELILVDYLAFIENFRVSLLEHTGKNFYNVKDKSGKIGDYFYHFHGAGCRLEKDNIVCEFDFLPQNEFPIKFSVWKFSEFINTNERWQHLKMELPELDVELKKLVFEKKLHLLDIGGVIFQIFQVENASPTLK